MSAAVPLKVCCFVLCDGTWVPGRCGGVVGVMGGSCAPSPIACVYKAVTEYECRAGGILCIKGDQEARDTRQGFYLPFSDNYEYIGILEICRKCRW